ncbi:hypothetical protein [Shewanella nanhaiensis]|uniref:Uncharacterized protein n=1 Tax=Shewanella nanhaiensis TaxID=2864872 RepID=A0ABS7E479_9GAMM|nr:hypothetical protein [Shewanella nanhaiensis]MBW8184138.1 hypothetical protein [Shewanella nanhaiensis]
MNYTITALFLMVFALSGCQSTQNSNVSNNLYQADNRADSGRLSSLSFIHRQGALMAETFNQDKDNAFYDWWDREHLLSYAHDRYPELTLSEEESFYRTVRIKFSNQINGTEMWRFEGVQGDNLVFSAYLTELPITVLIEYKYLQNIGQRELVVVNWRMLHHLTSGLDAYSSYLHNSEVLNRSGYFDLIQFAVNGTKKTEREVSELFDSLPEALKKDPTLLNDFLWASLEVVPNPSAEFFRQTYPYVPSLTPENSAFWGYLYMLQDDLEQFKYVRSMAMANLGYIQTNYALVGVLYSLQQQDYDYAFEQFSHYIKAQPNDAIAYAIYLNNLIDLGLHERASQVYQALRLQFNLELVPEDFVDVDPDKLSAFFYSDAMQKVSRL